MRLGHARRCGAEIVNYADDSVIRGSAPSAATRATVERLRQWQCWKHEVKFRKYVRSLDESLWASAPLPSATRYLREF